MIPLYQVKLEDKAIQNANEVMESGELRQGRWVQQFEQDFYHRFGGSHAVAVSSGTAALHLTCLSLFQPGDEILVPSFTFFASASAVSLAGCHPVFCDVDSDTYSLSLESVKRCMSDRVRGMIIVHLFGHSAQVDELEAFAKENGIRVIHDLAQAHGVRWNGCELGGMGDAACFSLYPTKNVIAGEGGMVTTNNSELADNLALYRNHGMDKPYSHVLLGYNYRMTDLEAAIGTAQLEVFDTQLESRQSNDRFLRSNLSFPDEIIWQSCPGPADSAPNLLTGRLIRHSREDFLAALREQGIGCGVYYPSPLHEQPVFASCRKDMEMKTCQKLCEEVFSLPVHPMLKPGDLDFMVETIRKILDVD